MSAGRSFTAFRKILLTSVGGGVAVQSVTDPSMSERKLRIPQEHIQPVISPDMVSDFGEYDDCSVSRLHDSKMERTVETLKELQSITSVLGDEPVSAIEADCAIECIGLNRDHLRSLLPPHMNLQGPRVHEIFAAVKNIVTDPNMIKTMMKKMEEKTIQNGEASSSCSEDSQSTVSSVSQTSSAYSEVSTTHFYASTEGPAMTWDQLAHRYNCTICQDVLAAPTILNCSHNFCGSCFEDWRSSCIASEESNVEVVHNCPLCKSEVECCIFERNFDAEICQATEQIPDCESKAEWKARRASYLEYRKKMEELKSQKGETEEEEDDEEVSGEVWEALKAWAVPVITLAVLYLVVICRK